MSEENKLFKVSQIIFTIEVPLLGTSILHAARMIGRHVTPQQCVYTPLKESGGKCRTCLVEESKSELRPAANTKLVASCRTTVMDGMEVKKRNQSESAGCKKRVVEFLLINTPD